MAMMMTGRVLLVCALCVLWCGLSGIAADGDVDITRESDESLENPLRGTRENEDGPQKSLGSVMQRSNTANQALNPENGVMVSQPEDPTKKQLRDEVETQKESEGTDEEAYGVDDDDDDLEEEKREEEAVETAETEIPSGPTKEEASSTAQSKHEKRPTPAAPAEGIPTAQSPATAVQPTTQGQPPKAAPSPEDSPVPAASTATVTPAVASSEQGNIAAPARKKDEKQSEDIDPAQESEQPGPQDVVLVQHSQGVHESKESNNNPRNPASASATANQRDAIFNGHGEPAQATSSNKRVFESNDANSGTEEGITSDDPTDAAGTNDTKNSQNMHGNTKETPVEATAMKGATATTGDSDGSTAVSHTTSPLLLLLVVACAAAAAVVAA
ncbi:Mucin-associated surface protein (MASP), subgroup S069 [Trypanosoma cruzi]|nr:Mucin-associated surface protein (MASP), subgroup S069 [Trypanosoma cruzi]